MVNTEATNRAKIVNRKATEINAELRNPKLGEDAKEKLTQKQKSVARSAVKLS